MGLARYAFIEFSSNMQLAERSVLSAALTKVITKIAARFPNFVNGQLMPSVVECINDIFPSHVAKHLRYLRLKHLKEMDAMKSSIRASAAAQKMKDGLPA